MRLTVGSLFSGIGGLDLGLERAGMTVRWQVENDAYCQQVLAEHWPDVPRYGDIKELDPHDLEPVDLICGGFPCQPVSQCGHKLVQQDARWLWPEFLRVVRHLRPRYVVVENVRDLLVRGMGDVLGGLAGCGYDTEWACLRAATVGAPHRRSRVFIVAHPHCVGREAGPRLFVRDVRQDVEEESPWGSVSLRGVGGRVRLAPDASFFRVADGFPTGVDIDRLRGLGNAVVPQVAEYVGRRILAALERAA